jgi:hypothetical protein
MGTGPAETIRSHPCHVNGGDDVVIPHAPKADPRTNRLRAALEPEDFALLKPQLEVIDLRRGQVLYGMGGIVHDTTSRMTRSPPSSMDGDTVETGEFRRFVAQMPGTASRISFERLSEVRNASPNLRQMIDSHPHRRRTDGDWLGLLDQESIMLR